MPITVNALAAFSAPARRLAARPRAAMRHLLCYEPLRAGFRRLCFPCNSQGEVSFADLSEAARLNYLFARACVGKLFQRPVIEPATGG